ncbi:MAG TPA: hypothetical protein VF790_06730 [Dissulfurispiraceae bacterium]
MALTKALFSLIPFFMLIAVLAGCSGSAKTPDGNRGVVQRDPVYVPSRPIPPPPPLPPQERRGAINPRTGEYLPPSGEGLINPRTGDYYHPVPNGYINPRTGEFIPKRP